MSGLLWPLVPLYAAAVGAKNRSYDRGWARPQRLAWPVVSIGNLSVGGSGKTPLTLRLVELLQERGVAVDVLTRGYGRCSMAVERVRPEGSAKEFGDEPLLLARRSGAPVFVGESRYAAGLLAESQRAGLASGVHLLDDGLQHRRLARTVDIVVLHRSDFDGRLVPAGRLREGFSSLSRAHIVAMREEDRDLEPELRRRGFQQPVWWMTRRLEPPAARRVAAFCAIARPEEFFAGLAAAGVAVRARRAWRDHHVFSAADVAELLELRRQHEAEIFVTTEKDEVRLTPEQRRILAAAAPLHVARLTLRLHDEAAAMDELAALLARPGKGAARDAVRK